MKPYHSLDRELRETFGKKLYKASLDGHMTCPNRDGTLGSGGCIFCSAGGSGEFAAAAQEGIGRAEGITGQIREAKERIRRKLPADGVYGLIAYFQSYTNTYAPAVQLRELFEAAMEQPEVEVLSIATRPDCLPEDVLDLLEELNRKKPVWVELGLQTIHPQTAEFIRRSYPLSCFDRAVCELKKRGITVIVHVIIGLPGEGERELLETIRYLNEAGIDGIKLQLLHILEETDLAELYRNGSIPVLSFEEYESLLFAAILHLDPRITIHRITGDGSKKLLIEPKWSGNKRWVLNTLHKDMKEKNITQGGAL